MSHSNAYASPAQKGSKPARAGNAPASESESTVFSLRDTLSGITVREANFSEFLAALKQSGMLSTRR